MKKLLLSLVCTIALLAPTMSFATTFKKAQEIYYRIVIANNIGNAPVLVYDPNESVNAMTIIDEGEGVIIVYKGLLDEVKNDDELALVLGHELGHWLHRGTQKPYYAEYDSDRWGAYAMDQAGYNHCTGANLLWRFGNTSSGTHPAGSDRFLAITRTCYAPR